MPQCPKPTKADKTRRDIVAAAEQLFAEKGFRAMTLRDVTRQAHVNLAAVNYHFGSKRELILAVICNRFEPINNERLRRLDVLRAAHQPQTIPLTDIFSALFEPLFDSVRPEHGGDDHILMQLIGRTLTEPADFIRSMHKVFFHELSQRYMCQLRRSCPQISEEALHYRFFFVINTMLGTIIEQYRLEHLPDGSVDLSDPDQLVKQLTDFAVAGFLQNDATP
jgi:AcrR family transcriptional regulator